MKRNFWKKVETLAKEGNRRQRLLPNSSGLFKRRHAYNLTTEIGYI